MLWFCLCFNINNSLSSLNDFGSSLEWHEALLTLSSPINGAFQHPPWYIQDVILSTSSFCAMFREDNETIGGRLRRDTILHPLTHKDINKWILWTDQSQKQQTHIHKCLHGSTDSTANTTIWHLNNLMMCHKPQTKQFSKDSTTATTVISPHNSSSPLAEPQNDENSTDPLSSLGRELPPLTSPEMLG